MRSGWLLAAAMARLARAELRATVYSNTAHAGLPVHNATVAELADALPLLKPWQSLTIEGQITAQQWALFSVDTGTKSVGGVVLKSGCILRQKSSDFVPKMLDFCRRWLRPAAS